MNLFFIYSFIHLFLHVFTHTFFYIVLHLCINVLFYFFHVQHINEGAHVEVSDLNKQ